MVGIALLLFSLVYAEALTPEVHLSLLTQRGLQIKVKDIPGLQEVGYHYTINKVLPYTNGDYNYEVYHKSGDGFWTHENNNVQVNPGDGISYALYFKINGIGEVISNLHWKAQTGTSSSTSTNNTFGGLSTESASANSQHPLTTTTTIPQTYPSQSQNMKLIFSDQFNGNTIDKTKWKHDVSAFGGGNWECQIYSPEPANSYVRDGVLYLLPTLTSDKFGEDFLYHGVLDVQQQWGICTKKEFYGCRRDSKDAIIPPIMSSKLITNEKFSFKYGRVEVEAKMPVGDWIWPAIWLMPRDEHYGGWPRSGEIDIVETRGNRNYGNIGIHQMMSTLHWGTNWDQDRWGMTTQHRDLSSGTWGDDFHTYYMDWTADHIILGVDGKPVLTAATPPGGYFQKGHFSGSNIWQNGGNDAPFDREFYLQMNVAVGGTNGFFPDNVQHGGYAKPWSNNDPEAPKKFYESRHQWMPTWKGEDPALKVRSVKIWSYSSDHAMSLFG
ncbi:beta-1,3-glucan-binding protein-like [Mercenaria mercenaria]|uniref:beta-1,3-glucan-binding protein-like n=1 Tax=Mercenaria mercenaria TaxID=6596 RepID=UPI00234E54F5|nr:beta-1,3-glucan-binding protein-like [Mercenaria mercenaria]